MAQAAPTVEVAKLEDVEALADIYRDAFSDEYMLSLFPDKDNAGRQFVITSYTNFINRANALKEGVRPSIAVVRDETGSLSLNCTPCKQNSANCSTGKPLGCAAYHIVPEGFTAEDLGDWRTRWTEPVPGMDAKLLDGFYGGMASQHHNVTKDKPHICKHGLFSHISVCLC